MSLLRMSCCLMMVLMSNAWIPAMHPSPGTITLQFVFRAGKDTLLPNQTYLTPQGDSINIHRFQCYVSQFRFTDITGKTFQPKAAYYLLNAFNAASTTITLAVPSKSLTGMTFVVGVDSLRNVSGVQTGALDPLNGMFWTWNSGYIMAKLEGAAAQSPAAGKQFSYHIGGYKAPYAAQRSIQLTLDPSNKSDTIIIQTDVLAWFGPQHRISIAATPICHSAGTLSMQLADNYAHMFSIQSQHP